MRGCVVGRTALTSPHGWHPPFLNPLCRHPCLHPSEPCTIHLTLQIDKPLPAPSPTAQATIVPRGHALGMVSQVPEKDEYSVTRQQMLAQIDVCMGGKAAEELIFGG